MDGCGGGPLLLTDAGISGSPLHNTIEGFPADMKFVAPCQENARAAAWAESLPLSKGK
jgi:hypothetical protein